jgi:hypothetical protein
MTSQQPLIILFIGKNGSKDGPKGPKGRIWEEKRVGLNYGKGQVFILAVACHVHANRMLLV